MISATEADGFIVAHLARFFLTTCRAVGQYVFHVKNNLPQGWPFSIRIRWVLFENVSFLQAIKMLSFLSPPTPPRTPPRTPLPTPEVRFISYYQPKTIKACISVTCFGCLKIRFFFVALKIKNCLSSLSLIEFVFLFYGQHTRKKASVLCDALSTQESSCITKQHVAQKTMKHSFNKKQEIRNQCEREKMVEELCEMLFHLDNYLNGRPLL